MHKSIFNNYKRWWFCVKVQNYKYKFGLVLAIIILVINLIFVKFLPSIMVTQWDSNGSPTTHMPKIFFLFFGPAIQTLIYAALRSKYQFRLHLIEIPLPKKVAGAIVYILYVAVSLIIAIGDIVIIYKNL